MKTYNSNDIDKIIDNLRDDLRNELRSEQNSKFRRFVVFAVALCLIISGITGVASYSLAATQVGYTPKDTSWTVQNTGDAIDELRDNVGASLVGSIFSYMGTTAPYGYLACDGSEYNIADYPRLANHINAHFGSTNYFGGDGETTFAVPDLRGEFLRGTGTNSHTNQGSGTSVGLHQDATVMPGIGNYENRTIYIDTLTSGFHLNKYADSSISEGSTRYFKDVGIQTSSGSATVYTTRPTNTSVLYIIKY